MDNNILLNYLRNLAQGFRDGTIDDIETVSETLKLAQDHLALIYTNYEAEEAPAGAEMLRELMLEALQLMFLGVDEFFNYLESGLESHLSEGIALAEEGNDVMSSLRHSVENDQEWVNSASVR